MFLHMKIRWILVAALFLLFAGLFAWEKGWLPFDPLQADTPITGSLLPIRQRLPTVRRTLPMPPKPRGQKQLRRPTLLKVTVKPEQT